MIIGIIIHDMKMTTIFFLVPRKLEQSNCKTLS